MKNKIYRLLTYILSILPLIATLLLYNKLPDQIPNHWDMNGTVTYGDKNIIWIIAFLSLFIAVLLDISPRFDPRKKNYSKFGSYYDGFCLFMVVFMDVMVGIILTESLIPGTVSVEKVVVFMLSILFIFMGNVLPKVKNNFMFGIKTPWTLSDPEVWNKTHRFGGKLIFVSGLLSLISNFLFSGTLLFVIFFILLIIAFGLPSIMSYIWYKNLPHTEQK